MSPHLKLHITSTLVAGAIMVTFMTFIITALNLGFGAHFLAAWIKAIVLAYSIGVPTLFIVGPLSRRIAGRLLQMQP